MFDSPAKALLRRLVIGGLARVGLTLEPLDDTATFVDDSSTTTPELLAKLAEIPGMVPLRRCLHLYLLAYGCGVRGDIVEIGSWQGRSTTALAQACIDTDNGRVHAIDTFRGCPGSPGHEHWHAEPSDLEAAFRRNIGLAGVAERVLVHPMTSAQAQGVVARETAGVRLLFVDGEHTYDAVRADLAGYAQLLVPGGLLVFDDYARAFPGVARAVKEHLADRRLRYSRPVQQRNMLVVQRLARSPSPNLRLVVP